MYNQNIYKNHGEDSIILISFNFLFFICPSKYRVLGKFSIFHGSISYKTKLIGNRVML